MPGLIFFPLSHFGDIHHPILRSHAQGQPKPLADNKAKAAQHDEARADGAEAPASRADTAKTSSAENATPESLPAVDEPGADSQQQQQPAEEQPAPARTTEAPAEPGLPAELSVNEETADFARVSF